ncbi:Afadin and alpha-actinin-binding-domain-containing protein [Russula dissimulans]|nr:Afadin and alpha-actinin-binding-domain-containing protein [Russula dissimulans]
MAAATPIPATKNTVHWAPSPVLSSLSDTSSVSSSPISSASTLQYINSQLISHGFAVHPGLSLDGLSTADAEGVTRCLLSMLSQRVEDMTRAEELTTKLRTLSYDHERLRTMHGTATETAEGAEREAAAARAKLTIANRAQMQAEAAHKQTMGDLQRARASLQALRATHVAELKRREKEIEAMRERWNKLADAQLKIGSLPSGMVRSQPANASALVDSAGHGPQAVPQKGLLETALEEAEKACALLREETTELKGLVVDAANAVRKILHKAVSPDPDNLEFPPPLAAIDLFPLGTPDAAFERLKGLLTALQDALMTLRASEDPTATAATSGSNPKPQISLADLAKKAAESDAKAHKWEIEELLTTVAGLREELKKAKERKPAPARRPQDVPTAHDELALHIPPTEEMEGGPALEPQPDTAKTDSVPNSYQVQSGSKKELPSAKRAKHPPTPGAQPRSSRLSPRKARSKSKTKLGHKTPLKPTRASASVKRLSSASRPRRLTGKRVEASFETEVVPSSVPTSLLPTSFVLPPPSPDSCLPPHPISLITPSLPLLFPSTTPPFPPPSAQQPIASSSTVATAATRETRVASDDIVLDAPPRESDSQDQLPPPPPTPKPFPMAKPLARNMSHAYSPAKPSPLSRILMLADSPENTAVSATTTTTTGQKPSAAHPPVLPDPVRPQALGAFKPPAAPVFQPPPVPPPTSEPMPAPAPLRTATMSNAAGGAGAGAAQRRRSSSKRKSREAELDLETDAKTKTKGQGGDKNDPGGAADDGMDVDVDAPGVTRRDPRAPEKDNTIVRRLKGGRAGVAKAKAKAVGGAGGSSVKTRKMTAAAAATAATKSEARKSAPGPAPVLASAPVVMTEQAVEVMSVGGAAGRLLAAARGAGAGAGAGRSVTIGPRRVPIDSAEAATGAPARRVS